MKTKETPSPGCFFMKDLIEKNLVEVRKPKKTIVVYAVTPKARTLLSQFTGLTQMLPIIDESKTERTAIIY